MNDKTLSIIVKAQDHASKVIGGVSGSLSSLTATAAKYAKVAAAAFGAAGAAATGFAVKSAADFEQTRIGLQNMLGSAEAAKRVLSEVSEFAAQTPFEFPELAGAVKQLVAFGFTGDDAISTMKQLGDVSAAVGTPMGDLAYLMGTLRTQGRAFTVDIRQFAQRGIPIYEYLAKVLGTTEQKIGDMIEAGKIGFPEVQKAFAAMTGEGGKFHGAMAAQSKSLSGLFSTLKDNIAQTGRELVGISQEGDIRAGSLFDKMRIAAAHLIDVLPRLIERMQLIGSQIIPILQQWAKNMYDVGVAIATYLGPKLEALWNTISQKVMPILRELWQNVIVPLLPVIGVLMVVAIGLLTDALNLLLSSFSWVIQALKDGNPIIWLLIGAFGSLAAAMAFQAIFAALSAGFATLTTVTIPAAMAQIGALKTLIATPMVMPAIAIGAALGSIAVVYYKIKETQRELDRLNAESAKAYDSKEAAMREMHQQYKSGKISRDAYLKFFNGIAGRATGGPVSAGTPYIVGEHEAELFVPNQSGTILNQKQMREAGVGGATFNMYGAINLGSKDAVNGFFDRLDSQKEMAAYGVGI